jgi:hypothetical protein
VRFSSRLAGAAVAAFLLAVGGARTAAAAHNGALYPALSAGFTLSSYAPGQLARLEVRTPVRRLVLQLLRAGAERDWNAAGKPFGPPKPLRFRRPGHNTVLLRVPALASGLYFVRLTAPGGREVTFAPFVLRPAVLGENRVAIVLPTYSWQAYNYYDADRDGRADSWYADQSRRWVQLGRPFAGDGKPPHYRTQQRGFLRFLVHGGKQADYLTDQDLEQIGSGDALAKLYDLVVFSGHEEYVTKAIYEITERYRDLGGNLAFLSADNFFWRVDRDNHDRLWRVQLWRNLEQPEAALIGVQYRGNDRGGHSAPYVTTDVDAAPWLFNGITATDGVPISSARYGIEFDATAPSSPPGTVVLAQVTPPGLGNGQIVGQMSYYTTPAGAKVFAAGTLSFGGSDNPTAYLLYRNLWQQLSQP